MDGVRSERAFRAMGSDAHVFVWQDRHDPTDAVELLDAACAEIDRLEQLWSRFLPESDVTRLNRGAGTAVSIAAETAQLLAFARDMSRATTGRFDPSVLPDLLAAGYDRSFELLRAAGGVATATRARTGATRRGALEHVVLDASRGTATLPAGAAIDLGGVGKGWTADLITEWLLGAGAVAACVNLGGDLRTRGVVPEPDGLIVGVEDPFGGPDLALLRIHDAGVATTARTRRHWPAATCAPRQVGPSDTAVDTPVDMHHVIDPATGRPAATGIAAVTVVAPSGALAEVAAKAVFLAGEDDLDPWLEALCASALIVHDDGATRTLGDLPELP